MTGKVLRAIGLMSGTSMDGIDVALLETDGESIACVGPSRAFPYSDHFRDQLRDALRDGQGLTDRTARPGCLTEVEQQLTGLHVEAVEAFLGQNNLKKTSVDVVGFHGQTVWHRTGGGKMMNNTATAIDGDLLSGITIQLGDGAHLARALGIPVVYDMRANDVAMGGQGAPLVPAYHRALAVDVRHRPLAVVNIGGVANVTWIGEDGHLLAFDTGPGNALIDDYICATSNQEYDVNGGRAAAGTINEDTLATFLRHDFFFKIPPKSLDRNEFSSVLPMRGIREDLTATLTAFTAETIARSTRHFPAPPQLWVVTGGGRKNATLMQMIAERVENAVVPAEAVGWRGDDLEAEAWAFLAVRCVKDLPITFPGTTGVFEPAKGGVVAAPSDF